MQFGLYYSALGFVFISVEDNCLVGLKFDPFQFRDSPISKPGVKLDGHIQLVQKVLQAISTNKVDDIPIKLYGTLFQLDVWNYLRGIPIGETVTYKRIASAIGAPKAFRAVANACGANPMPIIVPCHRAVRSDGSIGGFALGPQMKKELLDREQV